MGKNKDLCCLAEPWASDGGAQNVESEVEARWNSYFVICEYVVESIV
jgi:hypothetical protein